MHLGIETEHAINIDEIIPEAGVEDIKHRYSSHF